MNNVLLKNGGTPVLADFCESEIVGSRTIQLRATNVAPEVLSGSAVSFAADVYALGTVFTQLRLDGIVAAVRETVRAMCADESTQRPALSFVQDTISEAVLSEAANAQSAAQNKLQCLAREVAVHNRWSAFPAYWMSKRGDPPQRCVTGFMRGCIQTLLPQATSTSVGSRTRSCGGSIVRSGRRSPSGCFYALNSIA